MLFLHALAVGNEQNENHFTLEEIQKIQDQLLDVIPQAERATVCIELGDSSGSGVIVSEEGLVLTAAHVARGVGKPVIVILSNGVRLKGVTLGLDSETDAAMVQILEKLPGHDQFHPIPVRNDRSANLGEWVFALGHSGGYDPSRGAVARIGRLTRIAQSTFQSDCSLIGGDSGGPLIDLSGRLVGIHSRVGPQIPVNLHVSVPCFLEKWESLMDSEFLGSGSFAQKPLKGTAYLGIATQEFSEGLQIVQVGKKSPAEKAGIQVNDLLLAINEKKLTSRDSLRALLSELAEGDQVSIFTSRYGETQSYTFRLGAR